MNVHKKLTQWQEAGLIDAPTRGRIEAFEQGSQKPIMLYALGGLGALTVGIGIVSIVAANWDAIDKSIKLGADLLLGLMLATGLYVAASQKRDWLTDVVAVVYYVFTLASIALLGQIYQLGSPTYQALLVWSLCTAPFMVLVRGRFVGFLWLVGLVGTHVTCVVEWLESLDHRIGVSDGMLGNIAATTAFASLLFYLGIARLPWLVRNRPEVSAAWTNTAWTGLVAGGLALCFVWYVDLRDGIALSWAVAACGGLALGLCLALPKLYPDMHVRARLGLSAMVAFIWIVMATGTTYARGDAEYVGALAQIILLCMAAWTVLQLDQTRTFNVLTGWIALRILFVYFEVFGSMLDTGLGMISGGILTLLLAWVWKRKSPALASRLKEGTGAQS